MTIIHHLPLRSNPHSKHCGSSMAFQLYKKFLAVFDPRTDDVWTAKGDDQPKSSRISVFEDPPPPYTDHIGSFPCRTDEKPSWLRRSEPRVSLCPHETVSFEQLQQVLASFKRETRGKSLDALACTPNSTAHHTHCVNATAKEGRTVCTTSPSSLKGSGSYTYQSSEDPATTSSLKLSFSWDLGSMAGIRFQCGSLSELQHFLSADGIWLCPHRQLSDPSIVRSIWEIIYPSEMSAGPIDRHRAAEIACGCQSCDTKVRISTTQEGYDEALRVSTERWLGSGESRNDAAWLAQCDE